MLKNLPSTPEALIAWTWPEIEPYYQELASRPITAANVECLAGGLVEHRRTHRGTVRTPIGGNFGQYCRQGSRRTHEPISRRHLPQRHGCRTETQGKTACQPARTGRVSRSRCAICAPKRTCSAAANLPLLAEQQKLAIQYDKIYGAQTVNWEGEEITLTRLAMNFQQPDRERREKAWKLKAARQLADVQAINELWAKFMDVRARIAKNAGKPSYREYAWQQKLRFDYTPADCKSFASAIEQVVVPAATRIYEKRKKVPRSRLAASLGPGGWLVQPPHACLPVRRPSSRSRPSTNSSRASRPSSTGWTRCWVAISIPCWRKV